MNKWERKLRREGLGPKVGRRTLHMTRYDERINPTHGLVSPVYALSPSGDYFTDEERRLRARNALKALIRKHGYDAVERGLSHATVSKPDEPVLTGLRLQLQSLPR